METITLDHIRPDVTGGLFGEVSGIWGQHVVLSRGNAYLFRSQSGRGKTSALAFIYGLRTDYTGNLAYDGTSLRMLRHTDFARFRREDLSVVFQDLRLFRQLTAWENVMLKRQISSRVSKSQTEELFALLGIEKLMHRKAATLSFGEQQRVAVIRAMVQPFSFLLLDEPFSHLDEINTALAVNLMLQKVKEQGAGLILTSLGPDYGIPFHQTLEV
ncbi:MAG TPA: ATP-binding cassette domain-containing protein [Bacteroidales bacterium]|nr:ATP-binding cassette domain-containing protein [Bacteroidales bacterium]HRZ49956.1 ATP-binding cassette domain-containing protein [Bacteroidales bacterium]